MRKKKDKGGEGAGSAPPPQERAPEKTPEKTPPKKADQAPQDDAAVFASALEDATSAKKKSVLPSEAPKAKPAPLSPTSLLRDFFAEFDDKQNEFLALAESELKKQGRAERFAQRKIEDYLTFSLQKEIYGVPISKVREIIKPMTLTPVPRQPPYVAGILSLRGAIVPVFSLSLRLGLSQGEIQRATRIVVFEDGEELLGFYVDEVREVVRMPVHAVEPPPQWRGAEHQDVIRGVGRVDSQMIILLEFDTLVSHLKAA
ncbi:MAG: chemotaxis protein CheW [Deltaproteobacteria bacterium]|nr:chemotaxis protein CheW [Deltaproteobacteria bacterium]